MNFHPESSIWIYQSNRSFNDKEIEELQQILHEFTQSWTAHNNQLKAGFEIRYNQFIVLIVDETQAGASGCSIDKSVHLMKEIENKYNVVLFDRMQIAYKDNGQIKILASEAFRENVETGKLNAETIVFNNLVKDYQSYKNNWETTMKNSWHAKVY